MDMAGADTLYICRMGDKTRTIQVANTGEGKVPCEVRYTRNDKTEVLWVAVNEEDYCENRAREFVKKQEGWGWQCQNAGLPSE